MIGRMKLTSRLFAAVLAIVGCAAAVTAARQGALSERPRSTPKPHGGFADVTTRSGINFLYQRRPENIRQTVGPGVAFWDYDQDGWLDLFLVGQEGATPGGSGVLMRNLGNGTFADQTAGSGLGASGYWMGCAAGDLDNDGWPDLILTGYGDCRLFRNLGNGRFQDRTRGSGLEAPSRTAWATSAGLADVNRDGQLDIVIGRYVEFNQAVANSLREEWWSPERFKAQQASLYLNRKDLRFVDASRQYGLHKSSGKTLGVAFGHINRDDFPDLYLANDTVACDLLLNEGGKQFRSHGLASGTAYNFNGGMQAGMGADWGDYNEDGQPDLFVTNFEREPFSLYQNEGEGFFQHVSFRSGLGEPSIPYIGWGTKFLDYDNDGHLDLFCVNGHVRADRRPGESSLAFEQPLLLYRGDGKGHFEPVGPEEGVDLGPPMAGRGLAIGDYDNDGDLDLLVGSMSGGPRLLRNEASGGHRWIGLQLLNGTGQGPAIGARVTLTAAGGRQYRELTTGGSYLSSHDPRILFGLGSGNRVESIDIHWPNGTAQHLTELSVGRYYTYVQPTRPPRQR